MRKLLVCFDVDGTLIDDTVFIWQTLHDRIETDPDERKRWSDAFWRKEISYAEWASKDVEMWIRKNADRRTILNAIHDLKLMSGATEILTKIKSDQHLLGIISGSLDIALEMTLPGYKTMFDYIFLNHLVFDEHDYLAGIQPTEYDIEHKATGLREMARRSKISLEDTVFIGDNFNDIEVAKIAGLSIAFNCKSADLSRVSDITIEGNNLEDALPYVLDFASRKN